MCNIQAVIFLAAVANFTTLYLPLIFWIMPWIAVMLTISQRFSRLANTFCCTCKMQQQLPNFRLRYSDSVVRFRNTTYILMMWFFCDWNAQCNWGRAVSGGDGVRQFESESVNDKLCTSAVLRDQRWDVSVILIIISNRSNMWSRFPTDW